MRTAQVPRKYHAVPAASRAAQPSYLQRQTRRWCRQQDSACSLRDISRSSPSTQLVCFISCAFCEGVKSRDVMGCCRRRSSLRLIGGPLQHAKDPGPSETRPSKRPVPRSRLSSATVKIKTESSTDRRLNVENSIRTTYLQKNTERQMSL
ncbi:hypothetical protein CONLIGDRAFT_140693 [Coniochaeta ligniaria NRRL 30616]|uniref:Uncharacterized protein n=1 Tax=Coniochaeta ligniaria NRRL 30616 TaxID=1408157 RepID=A0A1J7I8A5_9PEZI|nr:hypothetical protein CONLIGDRAFT_140693 [Coniochaeta ligniaria NRRL 30616]